MRRQIKKHLRDFVAIIALVVISLIVGGFILANQRVTAPAWVPVIGEDYYHVKAQFSSGQSIVPGQGQAVKIAGVKVGDITEVRLEGGEALISMKIKRKYAPIYRNAEMVFCPTTLLKDENICLDPGSEDAGAIDDDGTLPQANTAPDVNFDEVLSSLDTDTRQYLKILLSEGAEGLGKNGSQLSATLKRLNMTAFYFDQINGKIAQRRQNLKRLVHNLQLLLTEVGTRDDQIAQMVDSVNANFEALASEDRALSDSVALLPGTLKTTRDALTKTNETAKLLGPTLTELRPGTRALESALVELRPFFDKTSTVIEKQLRPFSRDAQDAVSGLKPSASRLTEITPDSSSALSVFNHFFNELAYDPSGAAEPILFWAAWGSHNLATSVGMQDANGPKLRGLLGVTCNDLITINAIAENPQFRHVKILLLSLDLPNKDQVC